jgi:hypothetical protein
VLLDGFCTCTWALIFFFGAPRLDLDQALALALVGLGLCDLRCIICCIGGNAGPQARSKGREVRKGGAEPPRLPLSALRLRRQAPRWARGWLGGGGCRQGGLAPGPRPPRPYLRKKVGSKTRSRLCSQTHGLTNRDWSQVLNQEEPPSY